MITDTALDAAHADSQPAPLLPREIASVFGDLNAKLISAIDSTIPRLGRVDPAQTRRYCRGALDDLRRLERTTADYLRMLAAAHVGALAELRDAAYHLRVRDAVAAGQLAQLEARIDAEENA